ncbi:MAG: hypothetical protein N7Q72_01170 [Spiroplasma sp. Tabriz.8]|nr:hypothetical protein [Spiroplasma sp. Tabriz.8]
MCGFKKKRVKVSIMQKDGSVSCAWNIYILVVINIYIYIYIYILII